MHLLHRRNVLLAFPVVEQVLERLPNDFLVSTAYEQAVWTLIYLEHRVGNRAVPNLIEQFAAGEGTAAALAGVTRLEVGQFDRELRSWWIDGAPEVAISDRVDYNRRPPKSRRIVIRN